MFFVVVGFVLLLVTHVAISIPAFNHVGFRYYPKTFRSELSSYYDPFQTWRGPQDAYYGLHAPLQGLGPDYYRINHVHDDYGIRHAQGLSYDGIEGIGALGSLYGGLMPAGSDLGDFTFAGGAAILGNGWNWGNLGHPAGIGLRNEFGTFGVGLDAPLTLGSPIFRHGLQNGVPYFKKQIATTY